jgi:hypothetical protein
LALSSAMLNAWLDKPDACPGCLFHQFFSWADLRTPTTPADTTPPQSQPGSATGPASMTNRPRAGVPVDEEPEALTRRLRALDNGPPHMAPCPLAQQGTGDVP